MKIFVSHATPDKDLATKLVDLLQLGAGVPHSDIFFSSAKGSIPNGQFFVQYILQKLNDADLIVAILSRSYFQSNFCLAEAGAALARSAASAAAFHSFVVPPVKFADLDGALYGIQSGSILDLGALSELRERVTEGMATKPPNMSTWDEKRQDFLEIAERVVRRYEDSELLKQIRIHNIQVARGTDPTVTFKLKLRILLKNDTRNELHIESANWKAGSDSVPLQENLPSLKWQIKVKNRWEPVEDVPAIDVPPGRVFRTWIGLAASVDDAEVLQRCATRRLGTLVLHLNVGGEEYQHELEL